MQITTETGEQTESGEVHSDLSGYDGSRTPPDVQFEILRLHKRWGHSPHAIGQILSMDARTVKAVIAREVDEMEDARNYLKSHRLHIAKQLVKAIDNGAEKGKGEAAIQTLDRLDVTQPPKGQQGSQVAVQINLHGGPEPVSLVKVSVESESLGNQAINQVGLISQLMDTAANPPQPSHTQALTASEGERMLTRDQATDSNMAVVANVGKQA